MSSSADIKATLIRKIEKIDNPDLLKMLLDWIESSENNVSPLTRDQDQSILRGRQDIAEGRFKDHYTVMSRAEKWLRKET